MKRFLSALCCLCLLSPGVSAQLLTQNFNAGLPGGWQQSPAASWSIQPGFGTGGSNCIITEITASMPGTATINSPTLNLVGVTNFTISFNLGVAKNNFIIPNLALFYEAGTGPQFMARWGSGFTSPTTYTLAGEAFDPVPPLDPENIYWEACTHTVAALSGPTGRFVFEADMFNAGYVLLDDIQIAGIATSTVSTGLQSTEDHPGLLVYPNPSAGKKITLTGITVTQLQLFNQLGQLAAFKQRELSIQKYELDLAGLPAGIYFLNGQAGQEPFVRKIVINE